MITAQHVFERTNSGLVTRLPSGKVRDIYELTKHKWLLLITSDRISAFDYVLPTSIPDKGRILTQLSRFWFNKLDRELSYFGIGQHVISCDLDTIEERTHITFGDWKPYCQGRTMLVQKTKVIPFECVVRGYLVGSGWKDYQATNSVCGIELPSGLAHCAKLDEPLFTPATKAEHGEHDENVSFDVMMRALGNPATAQRLKDISLALYQAGTEFARDRGIFIADTKFEFGWSAGKILLIDEVLTPDSSRFWPSDTYEPGQPQASFDKQFVRDYLEWTGWNKDSEPPSLPEEIVDRTRDKYLEAYQRITDEPFE